MIEREHLPDLREGVTVKCSVGGQEFYVKTGEYEDGRLGEVFLTLSKEGRRLRVYDAVMIAVSIGLQYGIPLSVFVKKFSHMRMEPQGVTSQPWRQPFATSILDFVFQLLGELYCEEKIGV